MVLGDSRENTMARVKLTFLFFSFLEQFGFIQYFLRSFKKSYTFQLLDIHELLENSDKRHSSNN